MIGELDLLSAASFEDGLDEFAQHGRDVRLDLSGLDFMDSTGIRFLMRTLLNSAESSWRLQIEPDITEPVRRVFDLVKLDHHSLEQRHPAAGNDAAAHVQGTEHPLFAIPATACAAGRPEVVTDQPSALVSERAGAGACSVVG